MQMEGHSSGPVGRLGKLSISVGCPGEAGLGASNSRKKALARLAGLGVGMEARPRKVGEEEEELWPETLVGGD